MFRILKQKMAVNEKITVIPMEPGSGKSLAIIRAMVDVIKEDLEHAGAIIVKERVADCDATAESINMRVGWEAAVSYCPSKFEMNFVKEMKLIKQLHKYPILVVTHQLLYKRVKVFDDYKNWIMPDIFIAQKRNKMIIDEQPQFLMVYRIDMSALLEIKGLIQASTNEAMAQELCEVTKYIEAHSFVKQVNANWNVRWDKCEHVFSKELDDYFDQNEIYAALKIFCTDGGLAVYSPYPNYRYVVVRKEIDICALDYNIILLDGTAHINKIYQSDMFKIIDMPVRKKYGNVQVDVCRQFSGTKAELQSDTKLIDILCEYVLEKVGDEPTLILTLKETEDQVRAILEADGRDNIMVNHWGNIKGSNDYRHCTNLFILGFMFLPNAIYKMTYHRFFGEDRAKSQIELPKYGGFYFDDDDYNAMKISMVATEIVQGINRICCREPADKNGEAPAAYIFMLNKNPAFEEAIAKAMPGVKITTNTFFYNRLGEVTREKYKKTSIDALVDILFNYKQYFESDMVSKSEIYEADKEVLSGLKDRQRAYLWKHPQIAQLVNMGYIKIHNKKIEFMGEKE